jgi:DNA repair protein RadC
MSYLIKELPELERPRERFIKYGVEALSNEELLSILMRTGMKAKSVRDLSIDLLKEISINDLDKVNYKVLKNIKGIGEVKAITILVAIEFGKRVLDKKNLIYQIIDGNDVYNLVRFEMENELQEKFLVVYLDNKRFVIMKKIIFIGTVNNSSITPRDVFREAVKCNASAMILVHNHPGGSIIASKEDIYLTNEFIRLGKMMGISVLDHLIIGREKYSSMKNDYPLIFN